MGIISIDHADRLYWLGRYTERVYTTARMYSEGFDAMIDEEVDSYPAYCEKIDIPNIYTDKDDFMYRYPYDRENPDSIISNLYRAYNNAIELRETIGSEAQSYIQLAIYDMNKASLNPAPLIEMQKLIDNLMAFWGIIDDCIDSLQIRNLLKAGKRIERIDIYARMGLPPEKLLREVKRLIPRVRDCGIGYDENKLNSLGALITAPSPDYYKIVRTVDSII